MAKIDTGCKAIDDLWFGGIPTGYSSLTFGEPMIGKTFLCYQIAVRNAMAGFRTLYVDMQGYFSPEVQDLHWSYLQKRWNLTDDIKKMIDFIHLKDVFQLGRLFGMNVTIIQKEARTEVLIKFPKKEIEFGKEVKETEQKEDWMFFSPLSKELEEKKYRLVILDSFTVPVNDQIPSTQQNFPTRSNLEKPFLSAMNSLAAKYDCAFHFTCWLVSKPGEVSGIPWGGDAITFRCKRQVGIRHPSKEALGLAGKTYKQFTPDEFELMKRARLFFRRRMPAIDDAACVAILAKDTGYVDWNPEDKRRGKG